jgi:hypothetical protein
MPTPPWHGHLLRGITEVSRKLRTAERGGYLLSLLLHACAVPNRHAGELMVSALYGIVDFPNHQNRFNLRTYVKILPAFGRS